MSQILSILSNLTHSGAKPDIPDLYLAFKTRQRQPYSSSMTPKLLYQGKLLALKLLEIYVAIKILHFKAMAYKSIGQSRAVSNGFKTSN